MKQKTHKTGLAYAAQMPMRHLIDDNHMLLAVLTRFGISLGFGEATVADVCKSSGVHADTFLAIANFMSGYPADIENADVATMMKYLRDAHHYFLDYVAPNRRRDLLQAICSADGSRMSLAIIKFYDDFINEIRRHMEYENDVVFNYVQALIDGRDPGDFSIDDFSDKHAPMHSKLSELKELLVCHFTAERGCVEMLNSFLFNLVTFEYDLKMHCALEDSLFIPMIRAFEAEGIRNVTIDSRSPLDDNGDVSLTNREQEIISCIAQGMSNKEIAEKLFLSVHTVATHRRNICSKLNLHSASALAVYGIMHGFV